MDTKKFIMIGNPNVGKSTIFNKLTHQRQHTGNWAGKTVDITTGTYKTKNIKLTFVDLPGIYSLNLSSPEEKISKDYLLNEQYDCVAIICDATDLYRNLRLFYQVREICQKVIIIINMMDEAKRKNITIDIPGMQKALGCPIISCSAAKNINTVKEWLNNNPLADFSCNPPLAKDYVLKSFVKYGNSHNNSIDKKIDRFICGKYTRIPIMILMLAIILWLTVSGANYPSQLLEKLLFGFKAVLLKLADYLHTPLFLKGMLIEGAYTVLAGVVSVMLPPMLIFFPLFSLMEESGFLPRIAHNLDKPLSKFGSNGKQALTMCMGLGCNAVGVTSCRIMPERKSNLIAVLTNSFMPCNGRFPTIILLISLILGSKENSLLTALLLTLFIVAAVAITFLVSYVLSIFIQGKSVRPVLIFPPYRKPQFFKTIIDCIIHKALAVLGRAAAVAAPTGAILWLINTVYLGDLPLLHHFSQLLNPIGEFLAMDGVILLAFIMGIPANEIVLPIAVMIYTASGGFSAVSSREIQAVLLTNGWDIYTCISAIIFCIFHWPCATTLLTIKKETKSMRYTLLAFIIPTITGVLLCMLVSLIKII